MSFEEEINELHDWYQQRCEAYMKATAKGIGYLDSEHDIGHKADIKEYNRRLLELKKKYSVE
jgi:hypothetical protein